MEEKSKNVQETEKIDPFSRFMFGVRREQEFDESHDNDEKKENVHARDRDWLFGARELPKAKKAKQDPSILDHLNNVDYIELMHHVDTFMSSTKDLKPLVSKLKPYLESFLHKK